MSGRVVGRGRRDMAGVRREFDITKQRDEPPDDQRYCRLRDAVSDGGRGIAARRSPASAAQRW